MEKYNLLIIGIVAVVAIVGMTVLVGIGSTGAAYKTTSTKILMVEPNESIGSLEKPSQQITRSVCTDSDGGQNPFMKGNTTQTKYNDTYPQSYTWTDSCSGNQQLLENYCIPSPHPEVSGYIRTYTTINCGAMGLVCENGVCVSYGGNSTGNSTK